MNRNDWARAMTEAKKRKDCVWFRVNRGYNKSWLVRSDDQASCCSWINRGLAGRTRMVDHLHTYRHFEKWCREHPAQGVLVRFPEVRDLLAEIVLSEHKKDIKDGDVAASLMGLITNELSNIGILGDIHDRQGEVQAVQEGGGPAREGVPDRM